ncbi:MAG: hypothetical protein AABZ30_02835, partial [Myxococcota bacterium]
MDGRFEWGNAKRCQENGAFRRLADGDMVVVVTGPNALNMIVPSLLARDIDPRAPDPTVTVTIDGQLMAADIEGARADMQKLGDGFVLWNMRVPFTSELCCYECREAQIDATISDASGHSFRGSVRPLLQFRSCPDECACCASADDCPDPSLTQVCPGGRTPKQCLPPLPPDGGDEDGGGPDGGGT